jgi:hypothetical protein
MVHTKEQSHAYYMSRRTHYQNYAKSNNKWKDCSMCGIKYNSKNHLTTIKHLIAEQSLLSISLKKSLAKI